MLGWSKKERKEELILRMRVRLGPATLTYFSIGFFFNLKEGEGDGQEKVDLLLLVLAVRKSLLPRR